MQASFYALRKQSERLHLGAYISPTSCPHVVLFAKKSLADESKHKLQWLTENKKVTHHNARIFRKEFHRSSVKFVVGKPPPQEIFWVGEPERTMNSLVVESVSEEKLLSWIGDWNVGAVIVKKLAWSDAREMTFECTVIDP
jgi:hypothetical protein